MGMRDVVVLNTTSSRLEVQQSNDSVRISGDSNNLLSVENTTGTPIFSINAQSQSADIAGSVIVTGDLKHVSTTLYLLTTISSKLLPSQI